MINLKYNNCMKYKNKIRIDKNYLGTKKQKYVVAIYLFSFSKMFK